MTYDPDNHQRRSIRLRGYDYSQPGAYYVTICTAERACLFGKVEDGKMMLNAFGEIVVNTWARLPEHYPHIQLDARIIMPNHMHAIIELLDGDRTVGAGFKPAPTADVQQESVKRHGLPEIVRALKTFSARRINRMRHTSGRPAWQRNYYEHVIRDENNLMRIRQYISDNPACWPDDEYNPLNI